MSKRSVCWCDLFAQQDGPPVAQHGEITELMAGIGLGQRFGPRGDLVAREKVGALPILARHRGSSPKACASGTLNITSSGARTGTGFCRT